VGTSLRSFAHPCNSAIDYPQGVPKGKLCRERPFAAEPLEHIKEARLRRIVLADIASLRKRRLAELARIVAALRTHHDLGRRLDLVGSVPGIGERTAVAIVIRMPEIGRVSREQAAALAGLAPFDHDSGTHKGQRRIAGGRARLRRSLFAAALPAAFRWNKALIALYARLTARGKAHNAALVACARKLLIYASTVVQRGTPWTEPSAPA
jgi:transposase